MSKCRLCGKIFTKNEQLGIDYLMTSTNYYYHIKCYERFKQKPLSEEEWRMAIYDFITQDMKFNYNYWPCEKLREKYIKENGYTNKGIYFCLKYAYQIKKLNWDKGHGTIAIVPFLYEESKQYGYDQERKKRGFMAEMERQVFVNRMSIKRSSEPQDRTKYNLDNIKGEE